MNLNRVKSSVHSPTAEREHRSIVPVSPNYVVNKTQIWGIEMPTVIFGLIFFYIGSVAVMMRVLGTETAITISVILGILIFGVASSYDNLMRAYNRIRYHLRDLTGRTIITSNKSSDAQIRAFSRYEIKKYFWNGIIKLRSTEASPIVTVINDILFALRLPQLYKESYAVIIDCETKQVDDETLTQNLIHISGFLNSLPDKSLVKIKVSSKVPYLNTVEQMTIPQITKADGIKKDLLLSLHKMSKDGAKSNIFTIRMFLSFKSTDSKAIPYFNTVWGGLKDRLAAVSTTATIISSPEMINSIYASESSRAQTTIQTPETSESENNSSFLPALYGENSIWSEASRQFMASRTVEKHDHIILNGNEYKSCLVVGTPLGGVAGFPPNVSQEVIQQLYRLSKDDCNVEFTIVTHPIPSYDSLRQTSILMKKLLKNNSALEGKEISQFDIGHSYNQLEALYGYLKDGKEKIYDNIFIVVVSASSRERLDAGVSEVSAMLSAYNVNNFVPTDEIQKFISATRFIPYYPDGSSYWLPTSVLSRLMPLINGPVKRVSKTGMYFGIEIYTNQEIVIDLGLLGASNCLDLGPTRSGKTSGMMLTAVRTVEDGNDAIYVSDKKDQRTRINEVVASLGDMAQLIQLGRQVSGEVVNNINCFDIFHNSNVEFDPVQQFFEHADFVVRYINLLVGGNLSDVQIPYVSKTVRILYNLFGILPWDKSTWSRTKPTLKDVYNSVRDDHEREPNNSTYRAMENLTERFNSTLSYLSTQTNIKLDKQFTVIDLSNIHIDQKKALNYMLIQLLRIRFDPDNKKHLRVLIDEAGSLLSDKDLQREVSRMIRQAGSYNIAIEIGTQDFGGIEITDELRSCVFVTKIYGYNITKYVDDALKFINGTEKDREFLIQCSKPGMMLLNVGYPFDQTYYVYQRMSALEKEIILGGEAEGNGTNKQERSVVFKFINDQLKQFSDSQRIVVTDWIVTDTKDIGCLTNNSTQRWEQRAVGSGKVWAYISNDILDGEYVHINGSNQTVEHFFRVSHLAGYFISKGYETEVNHNNDADVVVTIGDKTVAFEYQTSGDNDPKRLMTKIENNKNKYSHLFFVGNTQSCKEIITAIQTPEIVVRSGKELERLVESLINKTHTIFIQDEKDS